MCFLFVKDGVFQQRLEDVTASHFKPFLWAFVDADENDCVPARLAIYETKLYIIFVSPPKPQRWKHLDKTTDNLEVIMNPWSPEEIHQA
jgi:hypothetical protein